MRNWEIKKLRNWEIHFENCICEDLCEKEDSLIFGELVSKQGSSKLIIRVKALRKLRMGIKSKIKIKKIPLGDKTIM